MPILRVPDENGNYVSIPAITGPKGDPGPEGPKGEKGDKGDPGVLNVPNASTTENGLMTSAYVAAINKNSTDLVSLKTSLEEKLAKTISTESNYIVAGTNSFANVSSTADKTKTTVSLGGNALSQAVTAYSTVAIGPYALGRSERSQDNIAIGSYALYSATAGSAGYSQTDQSGSRNIAIGGNAGRSITNGFAHVTIGRNSGQNIMGGTSAVTIGNGAMASRCPIGLSGEVEVWAPAHENDLNDANIVAVGAWAASRNRMANVTSVGAKSLMQSTVSDYNTALGVNVLRRIDDTTWINGEVATPKNITGTYSQAGNTLTLNLTAHGATVGDIVTFKLTGGSSATFSNDEAPAVVKTVPNANTLTVNHPVSRTTNGTAILTNVVKKGSSAPKGEHNVGVGYNSMPYLNGASENTAVGSHSAYNLSGGNDNTAVGYMALYGASGATSTESTAVGTAALRNITTGSYNTAIGWRTGFNVTTASQCTFIGYGAGRNTVSGANLVTATNSTALGNSARVTGDNEVQLGDSKTTTYAYGAVQNRSDRRDKTDIRDTQLGLDFVNNLRPVDFKWDMRDDYKDGKRDGSMKRDRYHHGLIAQELVDTMEEMGVDFGGLQDHSVNGGDDVLSLGYEELIAPLIKSVQELSNKVKQLEEQLGEVNANSENS